MRAGTIGCGIAVLVAMGHVAARAGSPLVAVRRSDLVVTSGGIEGDQPLRLRGPTVRATVGRVPRSTIEATFVYLGPTQATAPLASGELRRQVGLKLRAHDGCNVVYVMWHLAPDARLHVSVKSNPDAADGDCGDGGYQNVAPSWTMTDLRPLAVGEKRTLKARIVGAELQVDVDGESAWRGALPATAFAFDGPVGLRSDNAQFDVALRVSGERH